MNLEALMSPYAVPRHDVVEHDIHLARHRAETEMLASSVMDSPAYAPRHRAELN